ncbi:hypothetical protein [Qipengyuania atrilutea]|uniref:Lipoprotein n=1 Tax=Qipengyuania atrilutea TaxID=2744473 RepID=A0A850H1Y3_9SPHN|nr:hypothetical protein [Actirhodobacter atriluteus]NVD44550.1 hypothetical protein [Actirhodobacter atriluteus]
MRRAGVMLTLLLALAGCKSEPDFDERYEKAQKEIEQTAREIERDLEKARKDAAKASPSATPEAEEGSAADAAS